MDREAHWERVYRQKAPTEVGWYQAYPEASLRHIEAAGTAKDGRIIDVGGGASVLVDCLLDAGFSSLAVLDISAAAIGRARARLGPKAQQVEWHESDVTEFRPQRRFDLWHDRAVFHFLTAAADRARYVAALREALEPGGHLIMATFALDGPTQCCALDVMRYDAAMLQAELGSDFDLLGAQALTHATPANEQQSFMYFHFRRA